MVHNDFKSIREALNTFISLVNAKADTCKDPKGKAALIYTAVIADEQLHKRIDQAEKYEKELIH